MVTSMISINNYSEFTVKLRKKSSWVQFFTGRRPMKSFSPGQSTPLPYGSRRLWLAACLACVAAAAVDRQARQSCLVWCAPPDTPRHRLDTERTCLAVEPTQFTPPRQNSPVCFVSSVAVWINLQNALYKSTVIIIISATSWAVRASGQVAVYCEVYF